MLQQKAAGEPVSGEELRTDAAQGICFPPQLSVSEIKTSGIVLKAKSLRYFAICSSITNLCWLAGFNSSTQAIVVLSPLLYR